MRITGLLFVIIIFVSSGLFAQMTPPQLNCIEGDGTEIPVQWSVPIAPCGPLTGYTVFYASQPQGPYQSFTVNNPFVTDTVFAG